MFRSPFDASIGSGRRSRLNPAVSDWFDGRYGSLMNFVVWPE